MKNNILPWTNMAYGSKRRVEAETRHNLFWLIDEIGNVGLYINTKEPFILNSKKLNLKQIKYTKRNNENGCGEIILLCPKIDESIFFKVCLDLIFIINSNNNYQNLQSLIEKRLLKWQELFKNSNLNNMPIELQMGLFSELTFINSFLEKFIDTDQIVNAWGGPDSDKQDFSLDKSVVEIKSYATTKGPSVKFSSEKQLYSDKENIYLVAYALTQSINGKSIEDLVNEIIENYDFSASCLDLFNKKLLDYGYLPEIQQEKFVSFLIDCYKVFCVDEKFPKIPLPISPAITKLSYTLDLTQCSSFETNIQEILKK